MCFRLLSSSSRWSSLLFVLFVLLGVYFLTNLVLAVVYESFECGVHISLRLLLKVHNLISIYVDDLMFQVFSTRSCLSSCFETCMLQAYMTFKMQLAKQVNKNDQKKAEILRKAFEIIDVHVSMSLSVVKFPPGINVTLLMEFCSNQQHVGYIDRRQCWLLFKELKHYR